MIYQNYYLQFLIYLILFSSFHIILSQLYLTSLNYKNLTFCELNFKFSIQFHFYLIFEIYDLYFLSILIYYMQLEAVKGRFMLNFDHLP